MSTGSDSRIAPVAPALLRANPLNWLGLFGPGAIIASLTIGTGELIFSSRGGAIFGYRILWLFLVISILKWGLAFATSRHMILSGAHPFERWAGLPGPRGWFPLFFLVLAVPCFPVWIGFHAGVIGTMGNWLLGINAQLCGGAALAAVFVMVLAGKYTTLERVQLAIVSAMLIAVAISLAVMQPDWLAMIKGLFVPQRLTYPDWLRDAEPAIAARPVWVETTLYVGVIGGAAYDYLAYVSFMREKRWGFAGERVATAEEMNAVANDRNHPARQWVRAGLVDSIVSFTIVVLFSAAFVACGAIVLGPQGKIPDSGNMLNLQAEFLTELHPWLLPLYIAGAFLTMVGTLYGTIEVAPRVLAELARTLNWRSLVNRPTRCRSIAVWWCGIGGMGVVIRNYLGDNQDLVALITPVGLFTGVLACGFICVLAFWADRRYLPAGLRMGLPLAGLNLLAGIVFIGLGVKSFWDYGKDQGPTVAGMGVLGLVGAVGLSLLIASGVDRRAGGSAD
jgi:Mn2+/Fe2+ NRAMP family transporter